MSSLITPVAANSCQSPPAVPRNVALATAPITYDPPPRGWALIRSIITWRGLCSGDYRSFHSNVPTPPRSSLHTTVSSGLPPSHLSQRTPTNLHTPKFSSRQSSRLRDRVSISPTHRNGGVSFFGPITALHARHKRTLLCRELSCESLPSLIYLSIYLFSQLTGPYAASTSCTSSCALLNIFLYLSPFPWRSRSITSFPIIELFLLHTLVFLF
ncbi:unnamed protein product [Acanthosepion pharaonis]|uniref:Uncharacterized protein n=1 Tax=Acanthosepion pharaonis TaxID=158019 RepID=A0A812AKA4_ACAPH|nr:unnamed protein product [Sepia pharaonis]